ncbi:hypothetical protein P167DRAFT_575607 [Morchella conica CCBAS932]|uniref:EGF-like calcium-binding domain-containing protein n=1 Tax=Morchella conica CCBAS932 TaxID=1392247 RepID=A0A3N4KZ46_9PEZI|nr:hypothetical protein P167DRAFT_575607 [Morchella conica CCBAS932]
MYTPAALLLTTLLPLLGLLTPAIATPVNAVCTQCDVNPLGNADKTCDITTSCVRTNYQGQYHCACRAGYKSSAPNNDSESHYRVNFPNEGFRVFTKPGVVCDTLCDKYWLGPDSCQEVLVRQACL